jgi:hypothetical protein
MEFMEIKQEHRDWLDANIGNYETAKNGYIRNLELPDLQMYEHIYRIYLDPNFLLSVWCGNCKYEMIMRLYKWYEQQPVPTYYHKEPVEFVLNQQPKPKRKYTKKNG